MSVLGIASSSLFGYLTQSVQGKKQQFQQEFQQLGQYLQSGNLTAAQSDYTTLQKDFQSMATYGEAVHGHRHHHESGSGDSSQIAISQLLSELGSALQSGNLSSAQQAYTSLQQDLSRMAQSSGATSGGVASSSASNVSVRV
jgi:hypothetical protein